MKLPSLVKGWMSSAVSASASPERLMADYFSSKSNRTLLLLYHQFNQPIFHYLLTLSNYSCAEDILQATWLKVIAAKGNQSAPVNVKAWLFTIARNLLVDELRRQNRWQWQPLDCVILSGESLERQQAKVDELARFNWALEQLPFAQREVFVLQQEGFSMSDIANLTGEQFETVKSRLRYARSNLKQVLSTDDD